MLMLSLYIHVNLLFVFSCYTKEEDMQTKEETLKRPFTSCRRKRNADGEVKISVADAFSGKYGTKICNPNNKFSSRKIFFSFKCDCCVGINQSFLIQHSEKYYYENLKLTGVWFDSGFVRSFVQLCFHEHHLRVPMSEYKVMHCLFPDRKSNDIERIVAIAGHVRYIICPIFISNHFIFIILDLVNKRVTCFDGLKNYIKDCVKTVLYLLKSLGIVPVASLLQGLPDGWNILYSDEVSQIDSHSCGPICC